MRTVAAPWEVAAQPDAIRSARVARMSAPAPVRRAARSSGRGPRALASWNCQEDRFDEPVEFRFEYGAGRSALVRCIRTQVREARFECAQGGCEDSGDFAHDDGAGALATSRCLRDELD